MAKNTVMTVSGGSVFAIGHADAPERLRLTPSVGGMPPWTIAYHAASFDET